MRGGAARARGGGGGDASGGGGDSPTRHRATVCITTQRQAARADAPKQPSAAARPKNTRTHQLLLTVWLGLRGSTGVPLLTIEATHSASPP